MESEIIHVLSYYDIFKYPPTLSEIYLSLRSKTDLTEMQASLRDLVHRGIIVQSGKRYAKKREILVTFKPKERYSRVLTAEFCKILDIFSILPAVRLIGISGSLSMLDADQNDDVDLFVITTGNTLWITRFYLLFITRLFSFFGNKLTQKLCWNIFMEETNLTLPKNKQSEYTAHELIQLKILYDSSHSSQKLQQDNNWILKILPNVQINYLTGNFNYRLSGKNKMLIWINGILRYFQLRWLEKKGYKTIEYSSQVWFIQEDFERNIPIKLKKI